MIKFINDNLFIVTYTTGVRYGCENDAEKLKGELFSREEVKNMIGDLNNIIRLKKDMKARGHTKCVIITKPIYWAKGMEDAGLGESNNTPVRELSHEVLTTFINSIPMIAEWL